MNILKYVVALFHAFIIRVVKIGSVISNILLIKQINVQLRKMMKHVRFDVL